MRTSLDVGHSEAALPDSANLLAKPAISWTVTGSLESIGLNARTGDFPEISGGAHSHIAWVNFLVADSRSESFCATNLALTDVAGQIELHSLRMQIELDHLFVCTAAGAPEAERLVQLGFHKAPPNQHPGQGTACRRFSFANAMIELFWVGDEREARSESTKRTLLWERWSGRQGNASPFGICVRPVHPQDTGSPFPAWEYRPVYLSDPLSMLIGEAGIEEPMWVHLSFMRRGQRERWFVEHPIGIRKITALTLTTPMPLRSNASQKIIESGVLTTRTGVTSLLEIEFDSHRRKEHLDFRPHLPIIFQL